MSHAPTQLRLARTHERIEIKIEIEIEIDFPVREGSHKGILIPPNLPSLIYYSTMGPGPCVPMVENILEMYGTHENTNAHIWFRYFLIFYGIYRNLYEFIGAFYSKHISKEQQ